jgi:uncharacterized membrane protein YhfC
MVTTILFGLYSAGVAIALTLIGYFTGMDRTSAGSWFGWLNAPFLILFIWMAMNERKREDFGGTITYGQCIGTGTLVGLFAGIVVGIFMYVYFTAINPGMIDYTIQKSQAAMQAQQQMSADQIQKAMSITRQWFIPAGVGGALFMSVLFALIFSLIVGAFVKTKDGESGVKEV